MITRENCSTPQCRGLGGLQSFRTVKKSIIEVRSLFSFNIELSPERYWRETRSQEGGIDWGGGDQLLTPSTGLRHPSFRRCGKRCSECVPAVHCHHQNDVCIKMGSDESSFSRFIHL